ncbi:hypothetical protein [Paludisphaera rhizosphaerae]|uniref:hypothetical protein n=1 Tax=Paludisphaera rhizosphaerae TaxID=2711216 RepID=UPI0013E9BC88|nr:hypothetical protein [Paludisphaera rhizosphaerae]
MSDQTTISIPTDDDGFISQKCPTCSGLFKVKHGEGSDKPLAHCPYCGAAGDDWFTDEQRAYIEAAGRNFALDLVSSELEEMTRDFNREMPRGGFITAEMSFTPSPEEPLPPVPAESNEPMPVALFECCNERIKHDGSSEVLHCVICGTASKA